MGREIIESSENYDLPSRNHYTIAIMGVMTLRQGELNTAKDAFTKAIKEAEHLLIICNDRYSALDVKGLSYCGQALCGDTDQIISAKEAYKAARKVTSAPGIVHSVLQLFDALAKADTNNILAEVRPIAAGEKSD